MIYDETHDALEEAKARVLHHAMRLAADCTEGAGEVVGVLADLVRACEDFSAARAVWSLRTNAMRGDAIETERVWRGSDRETVAVASSRSANRTACSTQREAALVDAGS